MYLRTLGRFRIDITTSSCHDLADSECPKRQEVQMLFGISLVHIHLWGSRLVAEQHRAVGSAFRAPGRQSKLLCPQLVPRLALGILGLPKPHPQRKPVAKPGFKPNLLL